MSIWKKTLSPHFLERLTASTHGSMVGHLGIKYTNWGQNWLEATMPVNSHTIQPYGILHGGANVALAETLGSVASALACGYTKNCVGIDVSATHFRSVKVGSEVTARASPLKLGNNLHIWEIKIHESGKEEQGLTCLSRLTVMLLKKDSANQNSNKEKDVDPSVKN